MQSYVNETISKVHNFPGFILIFCCPMNSCKILKLFNIASCIEDKTQNMKFIHHVLCSEMCDWLVQTHHYE